MQFGMFFALSVSVCCSAPAPLEYVRSLLKEAVVTQERLEAELAQFISERVSPCRIPAELSKWRSQAEELRRLVLKEIVFRGKASRWRHTPLRVKWLDRLPGGPGYHIRKLRYEVLPGMWVPALLYEPDRGEGRVPVVLNVNGHDPKGKAAPYKQIRCANQARRGMLALNVEWFGMGQLRTPGFRHGTMNQLDLCGASGLAPFYLAMEKGLAVLLSHTRADPERVAVCGLSGGGWQTILISALKEQVTFANPVAGYSSTVTRVFFHSDLGDSEQAPVDLASVCDYSQLTALRAPRPTLLTYNAKDNCCFAAAHALPPLLEAAEPAYRLWGRPHALRWHVNYEPGTHNFEKKNREALYRALKDCFYPRDRDFDTREIPLSAGELKTPQELAVPLPEDNLDFNGLARMLMKEALRERETARAEGKPGPSLRQRLAEIIRLHGEAPRCTLQERRKAPWGEVLFGRLSAPFSLSLPVTVFVPRNAKGTVIVISDSGCASAAKDIAALIGQGKRVVAADLLFFGACTMGGKTSRWALTVHSVGERPLGIQVGQLRALARYCRVERAHGPLEVRAYGKRTGVIALIATSLGGRHIDACCCVAPLGSLTQLITENWIVQKAPELFCYGLLTVCDIPDLTRLCGSRVTHIPSGNR